MSKNIPTFNLNSFDPNKSNLVLEASAGTGKTYNVTEIVKKLVFESDSKDYIKNLRQILIVTFTEKATGELKDRIRKELEKKAIKEGLNIDFSLNDFNIYTIHSFCQNSISEFGLYANVPLDLNIVTNEETYLDEFVDRFIRERLLEEIESIDIFKSDDMIGTNYLKEMLIAILQDYYLDSNYEVDDSIIDIHLKDTICFTKSLSFKEFCNECKIGNVYERLNKKRLENKKINSFLNSIEKYYDGKIVSAPTIKKENFELEDYNDVQKILRSLQLSKSVIYLAIKNIDKLYKAWQEEKLKNKNQTFNDMIRTVRENVLNNEAFRNKLKEKYKNAIIDEFQDTNQLQFDIFKALFMSDDKHHIVVVGDPKQSIYMFQGADLTVYQKAVEEISSNGLMNRLDTNWRSTEDIVISCNKFFESFFGEKIEFSNSNYSGCGKEMLYKGNKIKALSIGVPESGKETNNIREYADNVVKRIIDYCSYDDNNKTNLQIRPKDEIDEKGEIEKQPFRNVSFKDFAILARSRSEMLHIERSLKKCGVPYIRYKDSGLFKGREAAHWVAMIDALNVVDFTGYNRSLYRKLMFTDFFGYDAKSINDVYFEKDDSEEMLLIKKWRNFVKKREWDNLIESIIEDSKLLKNLSDIDMTQSLSIHKQIGDYCLSYLYNNHTIFDLLNNLKGSSDGNDEEEDSNIIQVGSDNDAVKIMTIHASKGLQFPIVISISGFVGPYTSSDTYLFHDLEDNKHKITFFYSFAEEELIEEYRRLIYVDYTRAEYMLILPMYAKPNAYSDIVSSSNTYYMEKYPNDYEKFECMSVNYKELKEKVLLILNHSNNNNSTTTIDSQKEELKKIISTSGNKKCYKHAYSSLSHPKVEEVDDLDLDDEELEDKEGEINPVSSINMYDLKNVEIKGNNYDYNSMLEIPESFPFGKEIGSALHEIFEKASFTDYDKTNFKQNENKLNILIDECIKNYKIKELLEEDKEYIRNIVYNTLNAIIPSSNPFKLSCIKDIDKNTEIEFNYNLKGGHFKNYLNGFIDLTFRINDKFYIIDWKSDSLNEEDLKSYASSENLKEHTNNHYAIQRVLYAYTLVKWLNKVYNETSLEETFNKHFGAVYYVYIRGCIENTSNGIYGQTWSCFNDLEEAYNLIIKERVGN